MAVLRNVSAMSAAYCLFFLIYWVQTSAELAPPVNVTVIALNTNYTLRWDWDQRGAANHTFSFTTQYLAKFKLKKKYQAWQTVCHETSHNSCDITKSKLHYLGIYMLRVRSNMNGIHSDWVQKEFCPDKDAAVGPPTNVSLAPADSDLDVYISDPLTSNNTSMRELLPGLNYQILYWEHTKYIQAIRVQTLHSQANIVTLPNLKPWTWYCVRIQSHDSFYNKSSDFTPTLCMQTQGPSPWWKVFLYFLASLVICFLLVLFALYIAFTGYRTLKETLFPSIQLPPHFKEYLCDSTGFVVPHISPDSEAELLCDKVNICLEPEIQEINNLPSEDFPIPSLNQDLISSVRHSRQNSGSSGDSGIYSTEGSSGLKHLSSNQSSKGLEDSCQYSVNVDEVKMVKMTHMTPGLLSQCVITNESLIDNRV